MSKNSSPLPPSKILGCPATQHKLVSNVQSPCLSLLSTAGHASFRSLASSAQTTPGICWSLRLIPTRMNLLWLLCPASTSQHMMLTALAQVGLPQSPGIHASACLFSSMFRASLNPLICIFGHFLIAFLQTLIRAVALLVPFHSQGPVQTVLSV